MMLELSGCSYKFLIFIEKSVNIYGRCMVLGVSVCWN